MLIAPSLNCKYPPPKVYAIAREGATLRVWPNILLLRYCGGINVEAVGMNVAKQNGDEGLGCKWPKFTFCEVRKVVSL